MHKGRILEELWIRQVETYVELEEHFKVADSMTICLTDADQHAIYDYLGLEFQNLLTSFDELGLTLSTDMMGGFSHMYNRIKFTVLEQAQKSITNVINIENASIRNVQIIDTPTDINFIFTMAYVNVLETMPIALYGILKIIEHVCEGMMVSTDKDINLYINIGYGFIDQKHMSRAKSFVKAKKEELYGLENTTNFG